MKKSKAKLEIFSAKGEVIYTETFDGFYFIKRIFHYNLFENNEQKASKKSSADDNWKTISPQQYELYFQQSVDSFFTAIKPIQTVATEYMEQCGGEVTDSNFLKEVIQDSTVRSIDILCFDGDEGGSVIGYSRKQGKVVTLFDHD